MADKLGCCTRRVSKRHLRRSSLLGLGGLQLQLVSRAAHRPAAERRRRHEFGRSFASLPKPTGVVDTGGASKPDPFPCSARRRPPPATPAASDRGGARSAGGGYTLNFENAPVAQCRQSRPRRHSWASAMSSTRARRARSAFVRTADRQERHAVRSRKRAARQQSDDDARQRRLSHRAGERRSCRALDRADGAVPNPATA